VTGVRRTAKTNHGRKCRARSTHVEAVAGALASRRVLANNRLIVVNVLGRLGNIRRELAREHVDESFTVARVVLVHLLKALDTGARAGRRAVGHALLAIGTNIVERVSTTDRLDRERVTALVKVRLGRDGQRRRGVRHATLRKRHSSVGRRRSSLLARGRRRARRLLRKPHLRE